MGNIKWTREQSGIINSSAKHAGIRIIEATAGSGKSTVLTGVAIRNLPNRKNTLFISLTNSVRHELCNSLRQQLHDNYTYTESHEANHDYFEVSVEKSESVIVKIQIATLDSWVHQCLSELGYACKEEAPSVMVGCSGHKFHVDDYTRKREAFLRHLQCGEFPIESLEEYDFFMLDEVQDMDEIFIDIAVIIGEKLARQQKSAYFAGDMNQHIFGNATCSVILEMKKKWVKNGVKKDHLLFQHNLTVCFRCPPAHLKLVNRIFHHKRPTQWPKNKQNGEKPILLGLPSGPFKMKEKAQVIVEEICQAIQDGYSMKDIVIVSPHTQTNGVYCHLENMLSQKFCKTCEKITWLYTDRDHKADWSRSLNKLTFSSIHANKGRTHRMVIVLGLTDGALPRLKIFMLPNTQQSLQFDHMQPQWHIDECLLFVALTRSNGRMVMLIENDPNDLSFFFRRSLVDGPDLLKYCIMRENKYLSVSHVKEWKWTVDPPEQKYRTLPVTVSAWSKDIERLENLVDNWIPQPTIWNMSNIPSATCEQKESLGLDAIPDLLKDRNLLGIYGHYGELAFYRELGKLPLSLLAYKHSIVTNSIRVANAFRNQRHNINILTHRATEISDISDIADVSDNSFAKMIERNIVNCVVSGMSNSPSKEEQCEIGRIAVIMSRKPYAHVISSKSMAGYGVRTVLKCISDYERDCPTKDLKENTMWALSLAMGAMNTGRFDRPWLTSQLQKAILHEKLLPNLYENVRIAAKEIGPKIAAIEVPVCTGNREKSICNLVGRIDLVLLDGSIMDIKCPITNTFPSNSWVQLVLYAKLAKWKVPYISVLDIAHGKLETISMTNDEIGSSSHILKRGKKLLMTKGYSDSVNCKQETEASLTEISEEIEEMELE